MQRALLRTSEPEKNVDLARPIAVESVEASAYTVPTDAPESDGTLEWDQTTIVIAEVSGGG